MTRPLTIGAQKRTVAPELPGDGKRGVAVICATMPQIHPYVWAGLKYKPRSANKAYAIIETVCKAYGITTRDIVMRTRVADIREARQVAMYLLKKNVHTITLQKIGDLFGGYHHTSVLHNINSVQNTREVSAEFRALITTIERKL